MVAKRKSRLPHMTKILISFFSGVLVASLTFVIFSGAVFFPAQNELVEKWQSIDAGMTVNEAIEILGSPDQTYQPNELPSWAMRQVSTAYAEKHGILTYSIGTFGPNILLVFFDEDQEVTFVTSTFT